MYFNLQHYKSSKLEVVVINSLFVSLEHNTNKE